MTVGPVLGVFGGTFDPPHVGHLIVASDLVAALGLDRLLVVPSARPPHRAPALDAGTRLALTRAAFADEPRIEVCDAEYRRDGPSYTVETLEGIRRERNPARLFLVVGADQYEEFGRWRDPDRILALAELAVMRRDGAAPEPGGTYPFRPVDVTRVDLSSTDIRRRLAAGESIRYRVPDAILSDVERAWQETRTERRTG